MIVGMDFGTTNSGMAVYDGHDVNVLPLDPANTNPRILRTALYITNEQALHIGRSAVDLYYEQNIGRVVKTRKVLIGEIEVYGGDMYYVTDAYAWIDVSEPGRLLLSIKSRLREEDHPGAVVGQNYYSLEDLIALYLTKTRVRAEQVLGRELKEVVLGRPVHFSTDEEHDRLAQGRLLQAAFRAGYEKVYLQYEPVAAALSYERTIDKEQNTLIFDFGGGTLDITIMRLGDENNRQILATGGLPVAGDVFDQKLTRVKLPAHFGEGSYYGPRHEARQVPRWIYDEFSNWHTFIELQSQENLRVLNEIARSAQRRYQIEALISLVTSNYGLQMFDQVELAKRTLSGKRGAEIRLDGPDFRVREFVTRSEFERIIQAEIMAIEEELLRTLADSGLRPGEIDAVVRTGGSSQIPAFYEMLARHFGEEKVNSVDTFSSVTAGLGIYAHQIESGSTGARVYTPADVKKPPQARGSHTQIPPVNLDLLQKRVLIEEGVIEPFVEGDQALLLLGEDRSLKAAVFSTKQLEETVSLAELGRTSTVKQALIAGLDEQLLLATSVYRFLLFTPRQLLDLHEIGMELADMHRLDKNETFCAVGSWKQAREADRLLVATSLGYARGFPLRILRESIEAPVPLRLDNPLPGLPVSLFGASGEEDLLLLTHSGRGTRWPVRALDISGTQVVNCGKEDRVRLALPVRAGEDVVLITEDGYGRRLLPEWLDIPERPNQKARSLIARRSDLAGAAKAPTWAITTETIRPIDFSALPLSDSTRTAIALSMGAGERLQTLFGRSV
ncbi:MAG: Hsp70 family protein [Candidatus Promineifilaceae bacterium]